MSSSPPRPSSPVQPPSDASTSSLSRHSQPAHNKTAHIRPTEGRPLPPLPVELLGLIFEGCDAATLASVCLASSGSAALAAPLLYRDVSLNSVESLRKLLRIDVKLKTRRPSIDKLTSLSQIKRLTLDVAVSWTTLNRPPINLDVGQSSLPTTLRQVDRVKICIHAPSEDMHGDVPIVRFGDLLDLFDPREVELVSARSETFLLISTSHAGTWSRITSISLRRVAPVPSDRMRTGFNCEVRDDGHASSVDLTVNVDKREKASTSGAESLRADVSFLVYDLTRAYRTNNGCDRSVPLYETPGAFTLVVQVRNEKHARQIWRFVVRAFKNIRKELADNESCMIKFELPEGGSSRWFKHIAGSNQYEFVEYGTDTDEL